MVLVLSPFQKKKMWQFLFFQHIKYLQQQKKNYSAYLVHFLAELLALKQSRVYLERIQVKVDFICLFSLGFFYYLLVPK